MADSFLDDLLGSPGPSSPAGDLLATPSSPAAAAAPPSPTPSFNDAEAARQKREELARLRMDKEQRMRDILDRADKAAGRKPGGKRPLFASPDPKKKMASSLTGVQKIEDIVQDVLGGKLPEVGARLPKRTVLSVTSNPPLDIPPSGGERYTKYTQTASLVGLEEGEQKEHEQSNEDQGKQQSDDKEEVPAEENANENVEDEKKRKKTFTVAQKKTIMRSGDFEHFFESASKTIERNLNANPEEVYAKEDEEIVSRRRQVAEMRAGFSENYDMMDYLSLRNVFFSDKWSRHRSVTDVAACHAFPDLFLSAYNANEGDPMEPAGAVLVWSVRNGARPEFTFHCDSPVMTASFLEYHPALVVGGTHSGKLVVWDRRVEKKTPVNTTHLSPDGHTHPIYCAGLVGTKNAHNIVSISNDGRLCSWTLEMLHKPPVTVDLLNNQPKKPISVTAMDFPHRENNVLVIGAEDGTMFTAFRHGNKEGPDEEFGREATEDGSRAHHGLVTNVDVHPANGTHDFKDLVLSSSIDWTAKLWSRVNPGRPLYTFEGAGDYVYDVKWSPVHPAVFAMADGAGCLSLWNLNMDTERPVSKVICGDGLRACSKLGWSHEGNHIYVGDSVGNVRMYAVDKACAEPAITEWATMDAVLTDLRARHGGTGL